MQVFQEGRKPAELPVFLVALERLNLIEVIRLQQARNAVVLNYPMFTSTIIMSLIFLPKVLMSLRK
jgi:hypothetical protein